AGHDRQRGNDPHARVARMGRPRRMAEQDLAPQRELLRFGIEEQRRNLEIELGEEAERKADPGAEPERDPKTGAIHARLLTEDTRERRGAPDYAGLCRRGTGDRPASCGAGSGGAVRARRYRTGTSERGRGERQLPALRPASAQ